MSCEEPHWVGCLVVLDYKKERCFSAALVATIKFFLKNLSRRAKEQFISGVKLFLLKGTFF